MISQMMNQDADAPNVSPEEQAQYDSITTSSMKVVDDNLEKIVEMIRSAPNVQEGVSNVVVMIGERLVQEAHQNGRAINDDILSAAAEELTIQMFEILQQLGIEQDISEDQVEQALAASIGKWMKRNPAPKEELSASFEALRGQ